MSRRFVSILLILALVLSCFAPVMTASAASSKKQKNETVSNGFTITGSQYVVKGKKITLKGSETVEAWHSSKSSVAKVSKSGVVKGVKAGTAKITAISVSGQVATFKVTVLAKAVKSIKITASTKKLDLSGTKTVKLKATASPSSALQKFTWKSSDTSVAKVSSSGKVTALKVGKAKITATAKDGSKKSKSVTITVKNSGGDEPEPITEVNYRALVIGEGFFLNTNGYEYWDDVCQRNVTDMNNMADMLNSVYGATGGRFQVTKRKNATYGAIKSAIISTFADTTDNDVSLFFIATHGDSSGEGDLMMPFVGDVYDMDAVNEYFHSPNTFLPFSTLANWLNAYVKGKVIVILESCGAGSAIYSSDAEQNTLTRTTKKVTNAVRRDTSTAFAKAAINAFARVDGMAANSTGDFRTPKFYVLAAARHMEESYGTISDIESENYNFFTIWLIEGVGNASYSPADADGNHKLTLTELFNYISEVGDNYPVTIEGVDYYQHVQRYPVGSNYVLFRTR